jgi:hypothetical protein
MAFLKRIDRYVLARNLTLTATKQFEQAIFMPPHKYLISLSRTAGRRCPPLSATVRAGHLTCICRAAPDRGGAGAQQRRPGSRPKILFSGKSARIGGILSLVSVEIHATRMLSG